ncbi:two pore domain potassium channel family protein [Sphingomonas ginsenosidivorax]|uniref:Two pore domain potassium channel family protein n=1 Tax=Sphingomonas ginsenosidivorax TaxID=862135 RepID=A0A5C6UDT1_9SPHN|nr:ion channel [Sphingomonas ginsenosidivorax]TXC70560.1 two pore domain potassium channel family protein [Sphingomonas ginsenosidivorax]
MLIELALSTLLVLTTAVIHGLGLLTIGRSLRALDRGAVDLELNPHSLTGAAYTSAVVLGLLALAGIEIWFYAIVYLGIGATTTLAASVYFSTITYAAIGFSDESLAASWRLVRAIEGINGVLLMGWSVAVLVSELHRIRHR